MEEKRRALVRRLAKLEKIAEKAITTADAQLLFETETSMQILKVYLASFECSSKDPSFLDRKNINLAVNNYVLVALPTETKLEVLCLTRGQCDTN